MNNDNRVLARLLATELTEAELEQVAGGASNNSPSHSGPLGQRDDVCTDAV